MYKLLFFIIFLFLSTQGQAKWRYNADRDPFTDEKASSAIKTNPGFEGSSLIVRCKDGYLESYLATSKYLGNDDYSAVRFRFNKLEAEKGVWSHSTSGRAVFSDAAVEFARKIIKYSNLAIEAEDYSGEAHFSRFSLSGSSGPVGRVLNDCRLMRQNPRDIDSDIWRRIVQELDQLSVDNVDIISEALNSVWTSDKSNGDRSNIILYRNLSKLYVLMQYACRENKEVATPLPSCKLYQKNLLRDDQASYPVDGVDLLLEIMNHISSKAASDEN